MKRLLACAAFTVSLGMASSAAADIINFDYNGAAAGGGISFDSIDWQQGNSMLIETSPTTGTVLFQSNLNSLLLGAAPQFTQGDNGIFFTALAAFNVSISGTTFTFDQLGGSFRIYTTPTSGDALSGLGFTTGAATCGVGSTCILEAQVTSVNPANFGALVPLPGSFNFPSNPPLFCTPTGTITNCLDQFTSDGQNYNGIYTYNVVGGTHLETTVTSFNPAYFQNIVAGSTLAIQNTNGNLPFSAVDPSAQFSINAIANGGTTGASLANVNLCNAPAWDPGANIPGACVNGEGSNVLAQTDLTTTFVGTAAVVPEPATLGLFGLGLLAAAAVRRRQMAKK